MLAIRELVGTIIKCPTSTALKGILSFFIHANISYVLMSCEKGSRISAAAPLTLGGPCSLEASWKQSPLGRCRQSLVFPRHNSTSSIVLFPPSLPPDRGRSRDKEINA